MYLQLQPEVPERVALLAREVIEGGDTPYDRAVRLEQYLQGFPYTLDVSRPPRDRDVADYFLFELGEGYCDYFATTFVVMARLVGIPSRLAVGYVGGEIDPDDGARVVMEANGHAWPEVYFPGWGWVRFEPTGGRAEVEPLMEEIVEPPVADLPERPVRRRGFPFWIGWLFVVTAGGVFLWWRQTRRWFGPQDLPQAWELLLEEGVRLGVPRRSDQTIVEYTSLIAETLAQRADARRWRRGVWQQRAIRVRRVLELIGVAYTRYLYGDGPVVMQGAWGRVWPVIAGFRSASLSAAVRALFSRFRWDRRAN
jgi:hypothetical protein